MTVQPIRDYLVIDKDGEEKDKKSAGGLFIPTTAVEKTVTGTVRAVGSGRVTVNGMIVPLEVVVGDKIVFNVNLATEVKVGNDTIWVLREDQVLAILR